MTDGRAVEVRDNPARQQYELVLDGEVVGLASYQVRGETVVLPHTEVQPGHSGQGLGGKLVRGVLDEIRSSGRKVVPACSFVDHWIRTHPEDQDLLAR